MNEGFVQCQSRHLIIGDQVSSIILPTFEDGRVFGTIDLVYAGRFDPPTTAHFGILNALDGLAQYWEEYFRTTVRVVLWPHGPYGDKQVHVPAPERTRWMRELAAFFPRVAVRLDDVHSGGYTPRIVMERKLRNVLVRVHGRDNSYAMPCTVLHVIGADNLVQMGQWAEPEELWRSAQWLIVPRLGVAVDRMPPRHMVLRSDWYTPSEVNATSVRDMIARGVPGWEENLVPLESIVDDITRLGLYGHTQR